jgi:hypothetical protein
MTTWNGKPLLLINSADVQFIEPILDADVLIRGSTGKWTNRKLTTVDISDVDMNSVANGDFLVYDSSISKWRNSPLYLQVIQDVSIDSTNVSSSEFQILTRDGNSGNWKNSTVARPIFHSSSNFTLSDVHLSRFIVLSPVADMTVTIPIDVIPIGREIEFFLNTSFMVTFFGVPGVVIRIKNGKNKLSVLYSGCALKCIALNTFILIGDLM